MRDTDQISNLIGEIYDTALDAALWPQALKQAAALVGGPNAALWSKDASEESGSLRHGWGFEGAYVQAYFREYGKMDLAARAYSIIGIGEPVALSRLCPEHEYLESRFYREWAAPQNLVDCLQVAVDKTSASVTLFGVSRHKRDGLADEQACRRMQLLAPHIRRAVLVEKAIGTKQAEASALAETFDGLRAGMFIIDRHGRIVHANAAGRSMAAQGDVLLAVGGRLVAPDARINQRLSGIFAAADDGDAAVGTAGIALPLIARSGERYVANLLPLTSGLRSRAATTYGAVAALFVHKSTRASATPTETIAKAFQLTPTELSVLLAIVEVGGAPEVAEFLGIAVSTVRTHLASIYVKTGTGRQADLVKLVAGYANPLIG